MYIYTQCVYSPREPTRACNVEKKKIENAIKKKLNEKRIYVECRLKSLLRKMLIIKQVLVFFNVSYTQYMYTCREKNKINK